MNIQPVIFCGGSGTRLWPLSRAGFPKQFLCLLGSQSLFQQAFARAQGLGSPMVVGGEAHRFLLKDQLRELGTSAPLLLEPEGKNTAPALTLAALHATKNGADAVLIALPSDQTVKDEAAFQSAVKTAVGLAQNGAVCLLGVKPTRPETGFGYIHAQGGNVLTFVEKPDAATAQAYMDAGDYFWNAGMFVLKASVWLALVEKYAPEVLKAVVRSMEQADIDGDFIRPNAQAFKASPSISVDYAVMEKMTAADAPLKMVALDAGWSDLGAWDAVWDVAEKDAQGNACTGDVVMVNASENMVHAQHRLVSVIGLDNVAVIETPDAVLVTSKSNCQQVKDVVAALKNAKRPEGVEHRKTYRPWGWYDAVDEGKGFKVKRIQVAPRASLSLQKHASRAEHWVVVSGEAEVTCGENTFRLQQNESTYIPRGEVHRLSNPSDAPLEIIEVQSGDYLGEDDIVRLEDNYGRG